MIKVELSVALALYLLAGMVFVFTIWCLSEVRKRVKDLKSEKEFLWRCPTCTYIYVDSKAEEISRCPLCKSLVKKSNKDTPYGVRQSSVADEHNSVG